MHISAIAPNRVSKVIAYCLNGNILTDKVNITDRINDTLDLMPGCPDAPNGDEDVKRYRDERNAFASSIRDKYHNWCKLVRDIEELRLASLKEGSNRDEISAEIEAKSRERDAIISSTPAVSRCESKIFDLYEKRKELNKESIRFGRPVADILSFLLGNILKDILEHGLKRAEDMGFKTLFNKSVYSDMELLNHYSLYSNLETISSYTSMSRLELENEELKRRYTSKLNAYEKSKKENVKRTKPLAPQYTPVTYQTSETYTQESFKATIYNLFIGIKKGKYSDYRISDDVKTTLSCFCVNFIINLLTPIKLDLSMSAMKTIKPKHVLRILVILSSYNRINMEGIINYIKVNYLKVEHKNGEDNSGQI